MWSPDGSKLLFSSNRSKRGLDLYLRSSNAAGADTLVLAARAVTRSDDLNNAVINPSSWSTDGRFVLFSIGGPPQLRDLWVLPLEGERKPFPYVVTQFSETDAEFSPDGKWVAFASNESGPLQVYIDTFPKPTERIPVSTNGGRFPRWRRDGRQLFYENRDAREILSVSVASSSRGLEIGPAQRLFGSFNDGERKHWDVTPDGQMFLLELNNLEKAEGDATPITLLVNWAAGLRR